MKSLVSTSVFISLFFFTPLGASGQSNKAYMCDALIREAEKSAATYQKLIRIGQTSTAEYYKKKGQEQMRQVQNAGC